MSGPVSEVWPSLESMQGYIESWSRYISTLEARVRTLETMSQRLEESYLQEVAKLTDELAAAAGPKDQEIEQLLGTIKDLTVSVKLLETDRRRAMDRLASMLEVSITGATTLQDLIGQAMTVVDHSKAMIREHL